MESDIHRFEFKSSKLSRSENNIISLYFRIGTEHNIILKVVIQYATNNRKQNCSSVENEEVQARKIKMLSRVSLPGIIKIVP